jgi:HEAT repeat protein
MQNNFGLLLAAMTLASSVALAQDAEQPGAAEDLKLTALEALISAPADRALPVVTKVLKGEHSDEVKSRALFILSQIDDAQAHAQLADIAQNGTGELRYEAVRMIGIGGDANALASLSGLYASGDAELRGAVLEAYLIAGDSSAIYEIAVGSDDEEEFADAVQILGAMGAREELQKLRESAGLSESLIEAYAISGDIETLRVLARDRSDPEQQANAIEGLMIAGDDEGLLELYRSSSDNAEKRELLEALALTGSELVLDVIDEALAGE